MMETATVQPFRIRIPESDLDDLRDRLANTRWPAQLPGGPWNRGVPVEYLRELVEYWRTTYDWRTYEARLNELPQFTTEIDGQTIHFIHARSPEPDAFPLMLTHSWPNSIVEFLEIIGPLTNPGAYGADRKTAFHVVAPSLPGFGFSPFPEAPDETPWSIGRVADTWATLMSRLGYTRYGVHGNDAGALVSPQLGVTDANHVAGVHITGGVGMPTGTLDELEGLNDEERAEVEFLAEMLSGAGGSGYAPYLSSRPQTLSYGLTDSPVAQLAYLLERFVEFDGWPEGEGVPPEPIERDLFLTNVTLYWLTGTAASSSWTYYDGAAGMPIDQKVTPTGVSHGGSNAFRQMAETRNRIVHWSNYESPSHMVAMADPDNLIRDIREFFPRLR